MLPTTVEIPALLIVISAPLNPINAPADEVSKSNVSPLEYPEPPDVMSTSETAPLLLITTFAKAPSHVVVPSLKSLTF